MSVVAVVVGALAAPALSAAPAAGSAIFVAPNGNDRSTGTRQAPVRTITRASALAKPGSIVTVLPGTYAPAKTTTSGTADKRIIFRSATKWAAKIVSTDDAYGWDNKGDYVTISGFDVTGPKTKEGIESQASFVRILNNRVHDVANAVECDNNGGSAINHGDYESSGNEASGNWVKNVGPEGGCNFIQGIYMSQAKGTMANNIVSNVGAWCIHMWHGATQMTVINNLAFDCGTGDEGGGIVVGAGDNPPGIEIADSLIANNIVMDSVSSIDEQGRIGQGNRFVNNLIFRSPALSVRNAETGTVTADPKLVRYARDGSGNYRPGAGSPAIGGGAPVKSLTVDFFGKKRPTNGRTTIGPLLPQAPSATSARL